MGSLVLHSKWNSQFYCQELWKQFLPTRVGTGTGSSVTCSFILPAQAEGALLLLEGHEGKMRLSSTKIFSKTLGKTCRPRRSPHGNNLPAHCKSTDSLSHTAHSSSGESRSAAACQMRLGHLAKWLQEGKGTSQPLLPARYKALMQCVGNT